MPASSTNTIKNESINVIDTDEDNGFFTNLITQIVSLDIRVQCNAQLFFIYT